jgi:hypothetical protein
MKIIITEEQLRLIIENEGEGKLLNIPNDILNEEGGIGKMYNLYIQNKLKKNYVGIKITGNLNLDYIDDIFEIDSEMVNNFFDEVIIIDGDFSSGDYKELSKFSKLKYVTGDFEMPSTNVTELPNLIKVSGDLSLINTKISTLPLLERVDGDFYFRDSEIVSIPNLVSVGGKINGNKSKIESLPKLESVGADYNHDYYTAGLELWRTEIKDLPSLKHVDGDLTLAGTPLGKKLEESGISDDEINDKFGVKGKIYI